MSHKSKYATTKLGNKKIQKVLTEGVLSEEKYLLFTLNILLPGTPCASSPCFNGATCRNEGSSYTCECADGYIGDRCNIRGQSVLEYSSASNTI
jgi:hypothetical protein